MSKQIRIDDNAYEDLKWMAEHVGEKPTELTSMTVKLFRQFFEQMEEGGKLVIQNPEENIVLGLPFRARKRDARAGMKESHR